MLAVDPPQAPSGLVPRPALQARLVAQLHGCRVLVLHAPAGFGKTCALLSLFRALGPGAAQWLRPEPADRDPQRAARSLQASVDERPGRFVFIDALEQLPAACEGRWLQTVLGALPPALTLVMSARRFGPQGLEPLRASGGLVELGTPALRMGGDEVAALCGGASFGRDPDVAALAHATAGWPAIAALLRSSLNGHGGEADAAAYRERVARYLDDEVLAAAGSDDRVFLTTIAALGDVPAELADRLSGRNDSAPRLAAMVRDGLPVETVGEGCYRVHPVLAAHAADLAGGVSPQALAQLRLRAADWFAARGQTENAVGQLMAAGAWAAAMQWLPALAQSLLFRAQFRQVTDWCRALPPAYLHGNTGLNVSYIWSLFFSGDVHQALNALREMKTNMRGMCDPLVEQTINLQELILTEFPQHDYAVILQGVEALMPMLESVGDMNRGRIYNMLAMIQISHGELARAGAALMQAKRIHREVGNLQGLFTSYFLEAAILATGGDLKHALDVLENADDMLRLRDARAQAGSMHVFCVGYRLQLLYELGEYDLARDWLDRYQRLHRGSPSVLSTLLAGLVDARLTLIEKGAGQAMLVLERLADRYAQNGAVQRRIGFEMARIAIVTQDPMRLRMFVSDLLDQTGPLAPEGFIHPAEELEGAGVEILRLMLHAGGHHRAEAMQRLAAMIADTTRIGHAWRRMKLHLLMAAGHLCADERVSAGKSLQLALQLALVNGTVSSFLDEGPALTELLASLAAPGARILTAAEQAHAERVLAARGQRPVAQPALGLGERELEILRLVAEGLTNEQVALRLCLATQTVKWYLSGIYGKLGVGNRVGAVEKLRRLNVL
ncbi:LuxR C-terminal-related transcriptional regulator [Jeongeupia chitinilytica]|uniref:Helix-turn-helix transcriptional regulator n=1 Tax=Jeongeupia chitinilytica TaxID=1041641 RepID=A0ABQ3GYW1_9NEIS|nr:LuxR C-terminal-related transcriptional regulator [Jeongeupia chitinilytica]GHD58131.1 helix-turn-helix transcriptional regulator [Jeongeupia chitinilytica]